jgi:phosphatidylserine/phosphatidylglycerophosphate/cardiolipin synthase-like enzyme
MIAIPKSRRTLLQALAACLLVLQLTVTVSETAIPPALPAEAGSFTGVIVLPDDGAAPFLDELDAAQESIQLYIYLLSDEEAIRALLRAHHRGVDVRVMLDPTPYGGAGSELDVYQRLDAAGVGVRWTSGQFRFAHVKMLIVDHTVLMVMNLNWTQAAFSANREFAVVTNDADQVAQATLIFENDWDGLAATAAGPLITSPETSRVSLLRFITSAKSSVDIYAEVMTDPEIVDALGNAQSRGVRVRLVMSEAGDESLWHEEPGFLARLGVEVRIVNDPYIHAKVVIVDGELAWIGSQNFTANSLDNNREVGTFVDDRPSLARINRAFEADFVAGTPLTAPE